MDILDYAKEYKSDEVVVVQKRSAVGYTQAELPIMKSCQLGYTGMQFRLNCYRLGIDLSEVQDELEEMGL